ncbi:indole-diterpene biosynthesis protein-like protein PaxU [Paraphoma chrysanthemicola]|uniref:Indole-diterpene biosynthesis protein-like protein PaxU n=1 Tax=Paraphoma chrysanthemicola TaxID=798071 RepID=A0A8K0W576_9PLEO|nr:indole-diterpene biosynthesis protein-like protein PaxU [Paraphoma chrysanthemicola]
MSIAKVEDPTTHFFPLGPRISLYTPEHHVPGELIILCTWLGAALKHINKYIQMHCTIAPNARILLIQSDVSIVTSSYSSQAKLIVPAVQAVEAVLAECTSSPKILVHTFSNGGPSNLTQLLLALHSSRHQALPITGLILDSGPAVGKYAKSHHSMLLSLQRSIPWVVGWVICHCILILLFTSIAIGRYEKPETMWRRSILDEKFVGERDEERNGQKSKRKVCYVYSKTDEHVDYADVLGHAQMAREKGWDVRVEESVGTGHCGHGRGLEGKVRYEGIIRNCWEEEVE